MGEGQIQPNAQQSVPDSVKCGVCCSWGPRMCMSPSPSWQSPGSCHSSQPKFVECLPRVKGSGKGSSLVTSKVFLFEMNSIWFHKFSAEPKCLICISPASSWTLPFSALEGQGHGLCQKIWVQSLAQLPTHNVTEFSSHSVTNFTGL